MLTKKPPSEFKTRALAVVRSITPGHTLSYQAVAAAAGNPKAARAVATLMRNNYDPEVPCHRVIHSDGTLGGYNRGGTEAKKRQLQAEGWVGFNSQPVIALRE